MPRFRRRLWLVASVVLALVPVTFGLIRAVSTGADLRYLWLAGAAILGSMGVTLLWRGTASPPRLSLARALSAVAAGAICAGGTALVMGTTAGLGLAIVAVAFGLCTGTSAMFASLARQTPGPRRNS